MPDPATREAPLSSESIAAEVDATERILTDLEADDARTLRESEVRVTEEQREQLIQIRTDRELHERRLAHLRRRRVEVLGDELLADVGGLYGELSERQHEAIAKAETALRPAVWTRIMRALDGVVEGLETLQEAHAARSDRQALCEAFELWDDGPEIKPVSPLELGVGERLQDLNQRIIAVSTACDRTSGIGVGRVPHRPSDEVAELLRRREELAEAE